MCLEQEIVFSGQYVINSTSDAQSGRYQLLKVTTRYRIFFFFQFSLASCFMLFEHFMLCIHIFSKLRQLSGHLREK